MNIKEAKEQVKNAITAYFTKDKSGDYIVPIEKQRPVFLMGPPGIGKTAIMEQIASEMGVGLLSYSMTHHTRQSALGLPFIEHKAYHGKEYDVSEYTMSEIIASIYDLMEETGIREGILFLDEINCVSETLVSVMLQFLQYKVFGRHRVPDGWIIVTAGNPPEYNSSVRDFDIVTWDRLKRIDVEPDLLAWKEYAYSKNIHPAIMSYLEIEKQNFYRVESTVDGKSFITARGWEDLSQMIRLYELHKITVDNKLISQYVQNHKVCKSFSVYYDLFNKYKSDYQISEIIQGRASIEIIERAKTSKFDERLSLIGLILDAMGEYAVQTVKLDNILQGVMIIVRKFKVELERKTKETPSEILEKFIRNERKNLDASKKTGSRSREQIAISKDVITCLESYEVEIKEIQNNQEAYEKIKQLFNGQVKELEKTAKDITAQAFSNVFTFFENVFADGQEMLILVTELTANPFTAKYISKYGCEKYYAHNKNLLFYERQQEIEQRLEHLNLE